MFNFRMMISLRSPDNVIVHIRNPGNRISLAMMHYIVDDCVKDAARDDISTSL